MVSISQSRCLSFQVPARGAPDTLWLNTRTSASLHFQTEDNMLLLSAKILSSQDI